MIMYLRQQTKRWCNLYPVQKTLKSVDHYPLRREKNGQHSPNLTTQCNCKIYNKNHALKWVLEANSWNTLTWKNIRKPVLLNVCWFKRHTWLFFRSFKLTDYLQTLKRVGTFKQKCRLMVWVPLQTFRAWSFISGVASALETLHGLHTPWKKK